MTRTEKVSICSLLICVALLPLPVVGQDPFAAFENSVSMECILEGQRNTWEGSGDDVRMSGISMKELGARKFAKKDSENKYVFSLNGFKYFADFDGKRLVIENTAWGTKETAPCF